MTMDQVLSSSCVPVGFAKRFEGRVLKELHKMESRLVNIRENYL
jgi:hypothetical protein